MPQPPQIGALLEAAASQSPHRPALAYGEVELTYRELHGAADRLAARLGERAGERVAVIAANVPALVVALFGAWRAGATVVSGSAHAAHSVLRPTACRRFTQVWVRSGRVAGRRAQRW